MWVFVGFATFGIVWLEVIQHSNMFQGENVDLWYGMDSTFGMANATFYGIVA
jgi:hypothetical protein